MESPGVCDTCERAIDAGLLACFPATTTCTKCRMFHLKLQREDLEVQLAIARKQDKELKEFELIHGRHYMSVDEYSEWLQNKDKHIAYEENPTPEAYWYVFTLTTNNDEHTKDNLLGAASKLFENGVTHLNEPIIKGAYCLEYTEAGRPHIHGIYTTGTPRRLTNRSFQRAWKLWAPAKNQTAGGFKGGYHERSTNPQKYKDYINKGDGEGGDAIVFIKE